jgi:phosphoserine phosphatase
MTGDEVSEELQTELSNAEKKLKAIYDRRDAFQEEAKVFRDMRNDLQAKRREVLDRISAWRGEKDELYARIKEAKARRDHYNERAGILSGTLRKRKDDNKGVPYEDRFTLELELHKLEERYETVPLKIDKERELVEQIDGLRKKLNAILEKEPERERRSTEIKSTEDEVEDFRRRADEEHKLMNELFGSVRTIDAKIKDAHPTVNHLRSECDKNHEEYLKARAQADGQHQKAMELRDRVLQMREEKRKILNESRNVINEQNRKVKEELDDEGKLDSAADEAVNLLLKKGKISL